MELIKRTVGKNNSDFKFRNAYDHNKEINSKYSYKLCREVCEEINERVFQEAMILDNGKIQMPYLGYLKVVKRKRTPFIEDGELKKMHMPINYYETKKLWAETYPGKTMAELKLIKNKPTVMHTNEHTGGFIARVIWTKGTYALKGKNGYKFTPTRGHKRFLANCIKDPNIKVDFYEDVQR